MADATAHRKGVSFLSRIIAGTKKKDSDDDASSGVSDALKDLRPEGMEAQVAYQPVDNISYHPRHVQPPAYIRVRERHKKEQDFDHVFLAQELKAHTKKNKQDDAKSIRSVRSVRSRSASRSNASTSDTIWAMQFSKDGKYLAVGGQDKIIRIWAVLSTSEQRRGGMGDDGASDFENYRNLRLTAPVFKTKPIREFEAHTSTVLDLTWSKNNFLLSSSMDKTVRLWHVSRDECLCTFKHNDFVTSIAFHPKDDRFFLAGSLDSKLRLWSIPDKTVAYWNNLGDMITAVEFTPDGKYAIAGCLNGMCMFYETEGLKYQTQIHVRSTHGKNAKGSKITNIQAINYPPQSANGDTKLLITSNDSRIRLYNMRDKALEIKFKGNINDSSQIRATFSDDARYVICGSEDAKAFIWTVNVEDGEQRNKRPMEFFTASDSITTCVAFAPNKTRQVLSRSEDPIYDICNPPPVTLMSRAETAESRNSSRAPTEDGDSPPEAGAKPSPAYLARSTHPNGNIIVTADFNGNIKVFRQDCAWAKRNKDNWDTSSIFSKATGLRRSASIATKGSSRSLRSANGSARTQPPSERILSWRQGITSTPTVSGSASLRSVPAGRSVSPKKSTSQMSLRSQKTQNRPGSSKSMGPPTRPSNSGNNRGNNSGGNASKPPMPNKSKQEDTSTLHSEQPTNGHAKLLQDDEANPLGLRGAYSNSWWETARVMAMTHHNKHHPEGHQDQNSGDASAEHGLAPPLQRNMSRVSTLSIEHSDAGKSDSSNDEFLDALDAQQHHHYQINEGGEARQYTHRGSNSEVVCRQCHSNEFKAARSKDGSGSMRLCCTTCGTPA